MQRPCHPPAALAALPFWLVWRLVYVDGQPKPRKVPYYIDGEARKGTQASDADRARLVTYDEALACLEDSDDYYAGVGFALQPDAGIVALDFDDCVDDGQVAQHVEALCYGTYTEFSPSGTGVRAFFAGTLMSKKDVDAKRGPFPIEVFGHNGFVTFTGKITDTCGLFGWEETLSPITPAVLEMYRARGWDDAQAPTDVSDMALMALQPTLPISNAEVAEWLAKLPNDMEYDDWVKVGAAVHQQTQGSEEGFTLFDNWSKQSPKYTSEDYSRGRWVSFGRYTGGNMITFAWVIKQAKENELRVSFDAKDELQEKIKTADSEFILRTKLCPEIARDPRIDNLAREALAKVLQKNLKRLGSDYPLADCKRMLQPPRDTREEQRGGESVPSWAQGFVYVTDHDKFYRCATGEWLTHTGFNAKFNRYMPRADGSVATVLKSAAATALEDYQIASVMRAMYLPWANSDGDGTFDMDGVPHVNTYRGGNVPRAVLNLSDAGREAVNTILRHLRVTFGQREHVVTHVLSWLAFCVQNPGKKIRHAILIKGIEGDGKSLIGNLMSQVMGQANVKQISPKVLGTDFSDWAHGACLAILEEIKLTGHNRHDILNALKPNITNDIIPVHPKGKAEINVVNTMNYLAFTNHIDALPLSDTDRRWMVIFTPHTCRSDLDAALEPLEPAGVEAYWSKLHGVIASRGSELRRWLLDYPIAASFSPHAPAPLTDEKKSMADMAASPEEQLVRELLIEGGAGIGSNIVSATCLQDAAALSDTDTSLQTSVTHRVLTRLAWTKMPKRVKWRGRLHTTWFKGTRPADPVHAFEMTLGGGDQVSTRDDHGYEAALSPLL